MVIQRILRHANVSTTATYYIRTAADDAHKAMTTLENRIAETGPIQSDTNGKLENNSHVDWEQMGSDDNGTGVPLPNTNHSSIHVLEPSEAQVKETISVVFLSVRAVLPPFRQSGGATGAGRAT
jgi:hypothetical protein